MKVLFDDICDFVPGFAFRSSDFGKGEQKVIKIGDITPNGIDINSLPYVSTQEPVEEKYTVESGDYVMAMTGATIGKVGRIKNPIGEKIFINQRVLKFLPKAEFVNKDFLYYVIVHKQFKKYILNNIDSKLAQPNIGHPTIGKYQFELPPMPEQLRIASTTWNEEINYAA